MEKQSTKKIITAHDLVGGYGNHVTWEAATFDIGQGKFVGILGPNGAGKTTLFRILLGLEKPLGGTVTIFGDAPRRGNPRIGYVPQRHVVDSDTVIEALEFVRLGLHGNRFGMGTFGTVAAEREQARDALRIVGGEELAHRSLGTLSGGELQRVFLAEALVGKPDILLLDEPLANLDIRREFNLVGLIHSIVHLHGVTVLLIAHNINPLLSVLDSVLYVANGKIVTGTPEEIVNSKTLSDLYGAPVEVLTDSQGRVAIIGIEEPEHHHE